MISSPQYRCSETKLAAAAYITSAPLVLLSLVTTAAKLTSSCIILSLFDLRLSFVNRVRQTENVERITHMLMLS